MKRILLLIFFLVFIFSFGYGQVEITYIMDDFGRNSSEHYPDSLTLNRSFDSVGNIKTAEVINPCFDRPDPKITASGPTTFCQGDSVKLTAPPSQGYKWSTGHTTQSIIVKASGIINVSTINSLSCLKTSTSVTVKVNPIPSASKSQINVLCFGNATGSIDLTVTGGTSGYSYAWKTSGGGIIPSGQSTSQDITNLMAGKYNIIVTDFNGCVAKDSAIITQPDKLTKSKSISNVKCFGGNDGVINMTITGGVTPYSYSWSNSATTEDLSGLGPGSYYLQVTDKNSCNILDTTTITQPNKLTKSHSITYVKCFGGNDGIVDVTVSGGTTPYTYSWNNSATTQDLNGVTAGTYNVLVTDANACTIRDTVTVNQPNKLAKSKTITHVKCFGGNDGKIDITISGGTTPYNYVWSNSASTEDISNLSTGTYYLTVIDKNGCIIRDTGFVNQPSLLTKSKSITHLKCFGDKDGKIDMTISGGTMPYSYNWSNNATTEDLSALAAGTYNLVMTDKNGCVIKDTATVTQPSKLAKSKTVTDVKCFGGNDGKVDITIAGGTTPYSYSWSNSATSEDISTLTAGTYYVTVTDKNGCIIKDTAIVNQPNKLAKSKTITNVKCFNGTDGKIDVTISGGVTAYSYSWSNSATTEDLTNVAAGTHYLTVTDKNGCTIKDTAIVKQPSILSKSKSVTHVKCFGGNDGAINMTINGGTTPYSYSWSNNSTTEDLSSITAGTYYLVMTDKNGCVISDTATITQPSKLNKSKTISDVKCNGGTDGKVDITISGGVTPYTYAWSNSATTEDLNGVAAGTYYVTVTDKNACNFKDTAVVKEPTKPAKSKTVTDVKCFNGTDGIVDITITGGTTPYSYNWTNNATTEDLNNVSAGTYYVTVTDKNGCIIKDTAIVKQPTILINSKVIADVKCFGGSDGQVDLTIAGGTTPYSFAWDNTAITEDISGLAVGTYKVVVTDKNNCIIRDTAIVNQPTLLVISNIVTDVKCFSESNGGVNVTISGGVTPYNYNWSNGSTTKDITNVIAGSYTLTVTDNNICDIQTTGMVNQPALLVASHLITDVKCYNGSDGAIDLTIIGGIIPYRYVWNSSDTIQDISYKTTGTYKVTLTDKNLCPVKDSAFISQPAAPLSSSFTMTPVNCYGGIDGEIDLSVMGGTNPYFFSWSNTKATEDISDLILGTYSVKVTDFNGCKLFDTSVVTQPTAPLTTVITKLDVKCFGGNDGSTNLTINGGTPPYNFAWSNLATTEDISILTVGKYTATITDKNLCKIKDSITINQPAAPLSSVINSSAVNCFGGNDGGITLNISGGTINYSYKWSNGATTKDIANLITGKYKVTVTDANKCILKDSIVTAQPFAPLAATHIVSNAKCKNSADGNINLTVSGGTSPYKFIWSNSQTFEDAINLGAGHYVATIIDENGCLLKDSADISEPDSLKILVQGTTAITGVNNGFVYVDVLGGTLPYSYIWNGDLINNNDTLFRVPTGTYIIQVIDGNGCTQTDTFNVLVASPTSKLRVGPNPSKGIINVYNLETFGLDLPITFELYNLIGQLQMTFVVIGQNNYTFPFPDAMFNNAYTLRIRNDRFFEVRKITLMR